ncbi:MAG: hypothetical protein PHP32_06415 [Candidatus Izemoplasmatales bacterium]|nr:hypothetical protein [Candidatus Izemoplasmatales bacterium]
MLRKLIKHEFKASYRVYLPIYITIVGLGLLALLFHWVNNYLLTTVIDGLLMTAVGGLGIFTIYNLIVAMGQRVYGKPGYLLFAIPSPTWKIMASKIITHFVWLAVTAMTFLFGIYVIIFTISDSSIFPYLVEFVEESGYFTFSNTTAILFTVLSYALYFLTFFMFLFALLNLVYKGSHKVLYGILLYFALDTVLSYITSLPVGSIWMRAIMNIGYTGQFEMPSFWVIGATYFGVAVVLALATYFIIDRKTELQ